MFAALFAAVFIALSIASGQHLMKNIDSTPGDAAVLHRDKRFFPLFSVVRFSNSQCTASNSFNGTCFTKRECYNYGGIPFGTCANGFGVCCVFQKSCGTSTNVNNTYFTNPSYPTMYDGGERCVITVQRCNSDICQLRLDFLDFSLAQPTSEGECDFDSLSVSGGSSRVPRICGENTDQHMYVDFDGSNPISIAIDASTEYTMKRRWNIRIQQIACDSIMRAPSGCLQYYTSVSGTVMSFNYGTSTNPRLSSTGIIGTREIADLNYGTCVRMASGYCSIRWSAVDENSFSISGDSTFLTPASGVSCMSDHISIANPSEVDANVSTTAVDRFCGTIFTSKTTSSKPFVLYVYTNDLETTDSPPDIQNRGFLLTYKQLYVPC